MIEGLPALASPPYIVMIEGLPTLASPPYRVMIEFTSGGLNFREWARYGDVAYAGKWSLAVRATRDTDTGIDFFPVVARELSVAENGCRRMP